MTTINRFISEYSRAIHEGNAAVFAGAGLSMSSGYFSWKKLIEPLASEINLDIEKEHDLLAVAQYYYNTKRRRNEINDKILNEFSKATKQNENINILTRLPIDTYWTTNYDRLIEENLRLNNRNPDIKITQENLAINLRDRDAIVYKMHGDVSDPPNAVLIKDDYEKYHIKNPLFITALTGDLISKTFLFIGFSFEDPNLNNILSKIKILLDGNSRTHYCFFEKVKDSGDEDEFKYNQIKQMLVIEDLSRYGIETVLLDDYSDITDILKKIEKTHNMKTIFISGSLERAESPWSNESADEFTYKLSKLLVEKNCKIISGFGLRLGDAVINGALIEILNSRYKNIDEHLILRPFPQSSTVKEKKLKEMWEQYRCEMIKDCGIAIFIFGNKLQNNDIVYANGMLDEFRIANEMEKIIIPVGATGLAAKMIYDNISNDIENFEYLKPWIKRLGTETNVDKLVNLIIDIVKNFSDF